MIGMTATEPSLGQANYHFIHCGDSRGADINNQERGLRMDVVKMRMSSF